MSSSSSSPVVMNESVLAQFYEASGYIIIYDAQTKGVFIPDDVERLYIDEHGIKAKKLLETFQDKNPQSYEICPNERNQAKGGGGRRIIKGKLINLSDILVLYESLLAEFREIDKKRRLGGGNDNDDALEKVITKLENIDISLKFDQS